MEKCMLSKLSIKQKLILIMLIPLFVVILLAAKLAVDSFSTSKNLQSLDNVVILSVKIGDLVHETQKERGMTAGFLGSNGEKFKIMEISLFTTSHSNNIFNCFIFYKKSNLLYFCFNISLFYRYSES